MVGQEQGKVEAFFYNLGIWIAQHDWEIIGVGCLLLAIGCSFLQFVYIETDVSKLLISKHGRVRTQLDYVDKYGNDVGDGFTGVFATTARNGGDVRNTVAMLEHLEVAKSIHAIKIEHNGETFDIFDVGQFPGADNGQPLRISPLDCFQEGGFDWTRVHSEQFKFATIDRQFPSYHHEDAKYHNLVSYSTLIGSLVQAPNAVLDAYNGCLFLKVAQAYGYDFTEFYLGRCRKFLTSPLVCDRADAYTTKDTEETCLNKNLTTNGQFDSVTGTCSCSAMDANVIDPILALQAFFRTMVVVPEGSTPAQHDIALQKQYGVNYNPGQDGPRTHHLCTCKKEWTLEGDDTLRYGCDGYLDFADKRRTPEGQVQLSQSYSVLEKQYWCYIEEQDGSCGHAPEDGESGGRWDTCSTWAWDINRFVTTDEEVKDTLQNVQCGAWDGGVTGFNTIPWVREVVVGTSLESEDRSAIQTIYFVDDKVKLLSRWRKGPQELNLGPDFGRSTFSVETSGGDALSRDGLMAHKALLLDMYDLEVTFQGQIFHFLDVSTQFLEGADYLSQAWLRTPLDCFQEGGTSAAMVPASMRRVLGIEGAKHAITDILKRHDAEPDTFEVYLTPYNWCYFSGVLRDYLKLPAHKNDLEYYVASEFEDPENRFSEDEEATFQRWFDADGDGTISELESKNSLSVFTDASKFGSNCRPFLFDPTKEDNGDVMSAVSSRAYR
jgi:hypothetical protein